MSKNKFPVHVRLTAEEKAALKKLDASNDAEAIRILINEHVQGEALEEKISRAIEPLIKKMDAIEAGMREAVHAEVATVLNMMAERYDQ